MGGSPPSPPTVVMPAPTAPTTYRSHVPLESYKQAADYLRRLTEKTETIAQQRYQEVGTPAELGARQAQRRLKEEAAYLGSIPTSDRFIQDTTGKTDRFEATREASKLGATSAAEEYLTALKRVGESPKPITYEEPEWAKWTIPEKEKEEEPAKSEEPQEPVADTKSAVQVQKGRGMFKF